MTKFPPDASPLSWEELPPTLRAAIETVRAPAIAAESLQRALARAVALEGGASSCSTLLAARPSIQSGLRDRIVGRPLFGQPCVMAWAAAVAAVLVVGVVIREAIRRWPEGSTTPAEATVVETSPQSDVDHGGTSGTIPFTEPANSGRFAPIAAYVAPSTWLLIAEKSDVLVCIGPDRPLDLGDVVSHAEQGGHLHVWNWATGRRSRIVPGIEIWSNQRAVLSPDGKQLLRGSGDLVDLATGAVARRIDLGPEDYHIDVATYTRIKELRFSPSGEHLALMLAIHEDGPRSHEIVQLMEFPGGKKLGEFEPSEAYALRLTFLPDGRSLATALPDLTVVIREIASGRVLRQLEPKLDRQFLAVAASPDGRWLAAAQRGSEGDSAGDVFVWEVEAGKLRHRLRVDQGDVWDLAFSPDGARLAIGTLSGVSIADVQSGEVARLARGSAMHIRWSADGKKLTAVSGLSVRDGAGGLGPFSDIYPVVRVIDNVVAGKK